ncbi:hypothetical protein [Plantactinospora soyae]|uniref:Uncharacterized protein n=1 Tax=Plantactinospora soyae TaxID=1544732 RepID=A0A927M8Z2_9ACTN|nr:hypothetical protein [Plantactinospora soyae]MBE1490368.1 hypothetical protein [Plantactinospora soyae]
MTQNVAPDLGWAPSACTLPTTEQPLRVAEFDALFTDAVQTVARPAPTRLRLELVFSPMDGLVVLFPAHVTRYWARPDIAYLPVTDLEPLPVRAGVAEGVGERAHPGPGRDRP